MTDRLAALAAAADAVPYHEALGMRVAEIAPDRVRLTIPYRDANSNPGRALHGGVYASAIDAAGVLAARTAVDDVASLEHRTLDMTVHYLAAAIGEDIEADAQVVRRGKELAYVTVTVATTSGKPVATGMLVHRMAPKPSADRVFATPPPPIAAGAGAAGGAAQSDYRGATAAPPAGTGPASPEDDVPKLASALMAVPFMAARGMRITLMRDGRARVAMPALPTNADADGRVHEGAVAALLDTAGAMASWSMVGLDFRWKASTVAIHVRQHAPAASDVVAHARVLRRENESFLADVVVDDAAGVVVASGSVTYRIVVPE